MKKILISSCLLALILSFVLSVGAFAADSITITQQPTDISASIGKTGTATVIAAADGDIQYQWYFKAANGTVWQVSGMSGAKTATISVPVTMARLGQQYKCVLTMDGQTVESNAVTVVNADASRIIIDAQPMDIEVMIGQNGSATVLASTGNDSELRYQWYFKSAKGTTWSASGMTGATTETITVPVTQARIGQQYKCVITTADGGRAESEVVTILEPQPSVITIDEQPQDIKAAFGTNGTASVEASADSGAELSYQWFFKSAKGTTWSTSGMTGAKTDTISVPVTKARIGQQYKCVITTADGGRIESNVVTILEPVASVITIDEQPDNLYADIGQNGTATVEASADTGAALSYQWYFKKATATSWSASGMTGAKTATITVPVTTARLGQQYKCVITTADGGKIETDVVTICEKPDLDFKVTRNPDSYRTLSGEPVQLDVSVSVDTNTYPVRYQWYKDGEKVEGATESSLYFTAVTPEDAGTYYCVVSGYGYTAVSRNGTVKVSG